MVWPIIRGKSYVAETGKSMKAMGFGEWLVVGGNPQASLRGDSGAAKKMASIGCWNNREMLKASGRLGSYFPPSMEFTVCRDTPRCEARSA